jgi:lipid-A-disaccharide synthase
LQLGSKQCKTQSVVSLVSTEYPQPFTVGIVAGEASGDIIAANLMQALRQQCPHVQFTGIVGPRMRAAGCYALGSIDDLNVMGLWGVIANLPKLLKIRKRIINYFTKHPPDVYIGVDFTEFNLSIEKQLRKQGIKTVQYKSPSVYVWRQGRIKKIAKATDLMLALFPFETPVYEQHQMPVKFVGHPLADTIPLLPNPLGARQQLGLAPDQEMIAILPGSRGGELKQMGAAFLKTAQLCLQARPGLRFMSPMINAARRAQFQALIDEHAPTLPITLIDGQAHTVMAAADAILVASGTATLEAMLLKRPMVAAYRFDSFSYWVGTHFFKIYIKLFTLPNLLAGREIIPEFIQEGMIPEKMAAALLRIFNDPEYTANLIQTFTELHQALRCQASDTAARAVLTMMTETS